MKKAFFLSLLAAAACATAARADQTVYSNVFENQAIPYSAGSSVGQSFVTGGSPLSLTEVLFAQVGGVDASGNSIDAYTPGETFSLYANNPDNTPALTPVALATFTLTDSPSGPFTGLTDAVPNAPTILTANTRYWLVLQAPPAGTVYWDFVNPDPSIYAFTASAGVTLPEANTAFETNGATTTYFTFSGAGPQSILLQADVLPPNVPEPATHVLLALAGAGAFLFVRRARARAAKAV